MTVSLNSTSNATNASSIGAPDLSTTDFSTTKLLPYAAVALASGLLGGVGGYKVRDIGSKKSLQEERIKAVLDKLLITEYHLPAMANLQSKKIEKDEPQPIFSQKTAKEIHVVKEMIQKAIGNSAPPPNVILKGPAGTGKTMLGEFLCRTAGIGFIRIPSGAMEKHIKTGNHINAFREVIQLANESPVPTYIIMDDGEELIAQRPDLTKGKHSSNVKASWIVEHERLSDTITQRRVALVNAILEESGRANRKFGFCITTNRPDVIDSAFGTRAKIISIDPPTMEERKQIIITHLPTVFKFDEDMLSFFNKGRLEEMAIKTEGFTGRNIVKMLEDIYACVQLEEGNITQDIVDSSILAVRASVERAKGPSLLQSIRQLFQSLINLLPL